MIRVGLFFKKIMYFIFIKKYQEIPNKRYQERKCSWEVSIRPLCHKEKTSSSTLWISDYYTGSSLSIDTDFYLWVLPTTWEQTTIRTSVLLLSRRVARLLVCFPREWGRTDIVYEGQYDYPVKTPSDLTSFLRCNGKCLQQRMENRSNPLGKEGASDISRRL